MAGKYIQGPLYASSLNTYNITTDSNSGINLNSKNLYNIQNLYNIGTRLNCYRNSGFAWYKLTIPRATSLSSGKAQRFLITMDGWMPSYAATYDLTIGMYNQKDMPLRYEISLKNLGGTEFYSPPTYTFAPNLYVAVDADGYVYVQGNGITISFTIFPSESSATSNPQTYPYVASSTMGTASGFTPLKIIGESGYIYIFADGTGDSNRKSYLSAGIFVEDGTPLPLKYQSIIDSNNKLSTSLITGLATVATSGSYSDLSNKPTIPATNIIPSESTANKILLSTSKGGTAAWSSSTIGTAAYKGTTTSVTSGSSNLVTSGGVYSYVTSKFSFNSSTGTLTITN